MREDGYFTAISDDIHSKITLWRTMLSLQQLVLQELSAPARPKLRSFAKQIAAQYGMAARALLCTGPIAEAPVLNANLFEFWLIVSDYKAAFSSRARARRAAQFVPLFSKTEYNGLTAKIAIISEADFQILNLANEETAAVWSQFAQPARLLWVANSEAEHFVSRTIACAAPTLLNAALANVERDVELLDLWESGFQLAHSARPVFRYEERSINLVALDPERYRIFGKAALHHTRILNQFRGDRIHLRADPEGFIREEQQRWALLRRKAALDSITRFVLRAPY